VIKKLWWGENGFYQSKELKAIIQALSPEERQKLVKHASKFEPTGLSVLPI
jgi:hypothetical protein